MNKIFNSSRSSDGPGELDCADADPVGPGDGPDAPEAPRDPDVAFPSHALITAEGFSVVPSSFNLLEKIDEGRGSEAASSLNKGLQASIF